MCSLAALRQLTRATLQSLRHLSVTHTAFGVTVQFLNAVDATSLCSIPPLRQSCRFDGVDSLSTAPDVALHSARLIQFNDFFEPVLIDPGKYAQVERFDALIASHRGVMMSHRLWSGEWGGFTLCPAGCNEQALLAALRGVVIDRSQPGGGFISSPGPRIEAEVALAAPVATAPTPAPAPALAVEVAADVVPLDRWPSDSSRWSLPSR